MTPPPVDQDITGGVLILGDGTDHIVIGGSAGGDVTTLDPSLFTVPAESATGILISNVPTTGTLVMDASCFAGELLIFAGAPGWNPGTLTLSL